MEAEYAHEAVQALTGYLVANATLGQTLQHVAELAVRAVEPAVAAGLTLVEQSKRPVTVFASDKMTNVVDQAQYDDDAGPCLDAYRTRTLIRVGDVEATADTWPSFSRAAGKLGVRSSLSMPIAAGSDTYGALNLYSTRRHAFDPDEIQRATVFATQASVVLANASAYWDARDLASGLTQAMQSRAVIEQAKGKLMASNHCTADEAFAMLAKASQRSNVRLRDLAQRIVDQPRTAPATGD